VSDAAPRDSAQAGEWPPWPPPRPLGPTGREPRGFECGGEAWLAWVAGTGIGGTGTYNLALLEAVRFARRAEPDVAAHEALLAHGSFLQLFDEELCAVLERARRGHGPTRR
jgi:hypothetical protein